MRISDWSSDVCSSDLELTVTYLAGQIENGVDAVQLFDSWAGSLSPAQYEQWVIAPNAEIVRRLKALHPDTPVIGFPKGAGGKLRAYADETRSEEHTSELQSLMRISYAVFCLNKKTATTITM